MYNEPAPLARRAFRREIETVNTPLPPTPLVAPPPPPSGFARVWRTLLPTAIAVIGAALVIGVFDTSGRPAWIFVVGAAIGLAGVASLVLFLIAKSRRGIAVIEAEIEDRFGENGKP